MIRGGSVCSAIFHRFFPMSGSSIPRTIWAWSGKGRHFIASPVDECSGLLPGLPESLSRPDDGLRSSQLPSQRISEFNHPHPSQGSRHRAP